jgi:hypothetical protein
MCLTKDYPAFDYATISDVILHIRYTARQGVIPEKVKAALADLFQQANQAGLALLFSLRHDFPTEWAAFVNSKTNDFSATIRKNYFPYFTQGKTISIIGLELYDGEHITNHKPIDDPAATPESPLDLTDEEPSIPLQQGENDVLTRKASAQVFLIVRYTLAT